MPPRPLLLPAPQTDSVQTAASEATPIRRYGSSYLMDAVNSLQQDDWARVDPREELKGYLAAPVEKTDNVLHRWGVRDFFILLLDVQTLNFLSSIASSIRHFGTWPATICPSKNPPHPPNVLSPAVVSRVPNCATN